MDSEELKAMGIEKKTCKVCCRELNEQDYKKYHGYCKNCYAERQENGNGSHYEENATNTVAKLIKTVAIIMLIIGLVIGFINITDELFIGLIYMIGSVISAIFVFALGEIIDLLQRILDK